MLYDKSKKLTNWMDEIILNAIKNIDDDFLKFIYENKNIDDFREYFMSNSTQEFIKFFVNVIKPSKKEYKFFKNWLIEINPNAKNWEPWEIESFLYESFYQYVFKEKSDIMFMTYWDFEMLKLFDVPTELMDLYQSLKSDLQCSETATAFALKTLLMYSSVLDRKQMKDFVSCQILKQYQNLD